MLRSFNIRAI
jgi:hypothetical protein